MIEFLQTILVIIILGACGGGLDRDTISLGTMLIIIGTSILGINALGRFSKRQIALKQIKEATCKNKLPINYFIHIKRALLGYYKEEANR